MLHIDLGYSFFKCCEWMVSRLTILTLDYATIVHRVKLLAHLLKIHEI